MKNEIIVLPDGTKVAKDRSVGVVLLVASETDDGEVFVLCNQRGKRTSDSKLKWNLPSGYLDWDETGEEGARRECLEECGLDIPLEYIIEAEHSTSPKENRQNVIFRYLAYILEGEDFIMEKSLIPTSTEPDEVRNVMWISLNDLDKYDFAWGQVETIRRIISNYQNNAIV